MNKANVAKLVLAVLLFGGAAVIFARYLRRDKGVSEMTFFYDLSSKKLFSASRDLLPPIRGVDSPEEDGVRAIVIAPNGNSNDKANRKIAYLEKYSPELKEHLAKVRDGKAEPLPRGSRDSYRFVKRLEDKEWHAVNTPEAEKIMGEWNVPGPDGKFPAVCAP
jgi:hypothetical protein